LEMSTHMRLNEKGIPFHVDEVGSKYIDKLHKDGQALAKQIKALNPNCLSMGAGMMATLQQLADNVLNEK